jgi:hypothetical protein
MDEVIETYFSYTASLVLALCSLGLALVWPVAAVLITRDAAGVDFAIQLSIGWVSPVLVAAAMWPIKGPFVQVLILVLAVVYLGWTLLSVVVLVGFFYLPAAGFLLIGAVIRTASHPERPGGGDGHRPNGQIIL